MRNANFMYIIYFVPSKRMEFAKLVYFKALLKNSILIIRYISNRTMSNKKYALKLSD